VDTVTATFYVQLYDGATVLSSAVVTTSAANAPLAVALSGFISNPAGNLRLRVRDITATTGKILFNSSGTSKDSTITAMRIQ
jgi:hypothetical protein